jgi:hypothetical protein
MLKKYLNFGNFFCCRLFDAKPSRINHHMNSHDEMWQMWHLVFMPKLDSIKGDIGCTGTPCRKHNI